MSAAGIYRAALAANWKETLSAGEQGAVLLIGGDRKQARILRQYCAGLLEAPLLAGMVTRTTEEKVEFANGSLHPTRASQALHDLPFAVMGRLHRSSTRSRSCGGIAIARAGLSFTVHLH
jgi:hypothetical protein